VSEHAGLRVSPPRPAPTRAQARGRSLPARAGALWMLPALCAALYLLTVLVNFHEIITSVYVSSDAALAPVLGQAAAHLPPGSYVSLGNHAWYEEWLFLQATRSLSWHRGLWETAPALWSLFGVGLLSWSAARAFDVWSAAVTGAALLCTGAFGRFCLVAVNWHSLSLVHTIVLAAALVWVAPRLQEIGAGALAALAAGLGLIGALPTASDSLFGFWALAPLLGASLILSRRLAARARRRLALLTGTIIVLSVAGGIAIAAVMRSSGITARALPVSPAPGAVVHNLALMARSYAFLAGGRLDALGSGGQGVLTFASAVLVLAGLLLVVGELIAICVRPARRSGLSQARLAHVSFWGLSLLFTTLVYLGTDAPKDALSGRYLLAGYAAVAALLPLAGTRAKGRAALTAGVCAFALIASWQLIRAPFKVVSSPEVAVSFPGPGTAAQLTAFARTEHVSVGYGGYWDAEELTWATKFAVPVRPVRVCGPRVHTLCYPQLGMISSWYRPRPGIRSLLIVDSLGTSFNGILAADPALGAPVARRRIGPLSVLVYPYDIASRIGPPRCRFSWAHPC